MNQPAAILLLAAALALARPAAAAPKITCDQPVHDYGAVPPATLVDHTFEIRNTGDQELTISNYKGSCGCTSVTLTTNTIPPGGTAKLRALVDLKNRNGTQNKIVFINSNDPATGTYILYLNGRVTEDYEYAPAHLMPGTIPADTPVTQQIILRNNTPNPLRITNAHSLSPHLAVTHAAGTNDRTHRITVTTRPPLSPGDLRTRIRIETDSPHHPFREIPYEATIAGKIITVINPDPIPATLTQPCIRNINLVPAPGRTFNITNVTAPRPDITVLTSPGTGPGGSRRITLRIPPPAAPLAGQNVKITTDLPEMPEILVPLTVTP